MCTGIKSDEPVCQAVFLAKLFAICLRVEHARVSAVGDQLSAVFVDLAGVWLAAGMKGFVITSTIDHNALPNPLDKTVALETGAWLKNYSLYPATMLVPASHHETLRPLTKNSSVEPVARFRYQRPMPRFAKPPR